jgi:hypothetical protein
MFDNFSASREKSIKIYKDLLTYFSSKEAKENYKVLGKWLGFLTIYLLTFSFLLYNYAMQSFEVIKEKIKEKEKENQTPE